MKTEVLRQLLSTLKSRKGATLAELSKAVPEHYLYTDYPADSLVRDPLLTLVRWGFVEAYDGSTLVSSLTIADLRLSRSLTFYVSKHAVEIEEAFGIKLDASPSMVFGEPHSRFDQWPTVFVVMPFVAELEPVYNDHIKKITAAKYLTVGRADDFFFGWVHHGRRVVCYQRRVRSHSRLHRSQSERLLRDGNRACARQIDDTH